MTQYNLGTIIFHWFIGVGLIAQIAVGLIMNHGELDAELQFHLYQFHISLGITLMLFIALRIVWRIFIHVPPFPPTLPSAIRFMAAGMHHLLYVFQLLVPLSGWALVSVSTLGIPTVVFGVISWPEIPLLSTLQDKGSAEMIMRQTHHWAAWIFIALITLHIMAAFYHLLILRDGIFMRIIPLRRLQKK